MTLKKSDSININPRTGTIESDSKREEKKYFKLLNSVLWFRGQNEKKNQYRYINTRLYNLIKQKASQYKRDNYDREMDLPRRLKISAAMKIVNQTRDKSIYKTQEWKKQAQKNALAGHTKDRIYKYKNNPNTTKPKKQYAVCLIIKNEKIKQTTINQIPQYEKYGWKKLVPDDGATPSRVPLSEANTSL